MQYLKWVAIACAASVSGAFAQSYSAVADSLHRAGMAAYRSGEFSRAAEAFSRLGELTSSSTAMFIAGATHARLGHRDSALAWLERAVTAGFRGLALLRTDPDLDSFRPDPRFASLLA